MEMRTFKKAVAGAILSVALCGCMCIKDTSGIRRCLEDSGRAAIRAVELKEANPDKNSPSYKKAEALFNRAAGTTNGWMDGIMFDAKTKHKLNVSLQDYNNSDTSKSIAAFLALEPERVAIKALDPVTIAAVVKVVEAAIEIIQSQRRKQIEAAIKTIEEEFAKARWTTFENTTAEWVAKRYPRPGSGK